MDWAVGDELGEEILDLKGSLWGGGYNTPLGEAPLISSVSLRAEDSYLDSKILYLAVVDDVRCRRGCSPSME